MAFIMPCCKKDGRLDTAKFVWRQEMKKSKVRTFKSRLREDLKDPAFKAHYFEERHALHLAMKIANQDA